MDANDATSISQQRVLETVKCRRQIARIRQCVTFQLCAATRCAGSTAARSCDLHSSAARPRKPVFNRITALWDSFVTTTCELTMSPARENSRYLNGGSIHVPYDTAKMAANGCNAMVLLHHRNTASTTSQVVEVDEVFKDASVTSLAMEALKRVRVEPRTL